MNKPPRTSRSGTQGPARGAPAARPASAAGNGQGAGVVLLEVIFAVALFASASAVVGMALKSALETARRMRLQTQALNLAQSVLSDLAVGRIEMVDTPETAYDEDDPRWTYEILTEPLTDASNLKRVTVIVRCADAPELRPAELTQLMLSADQVGLPTEEFAP